MTFSKILIVQTAFIGDVVLTLPLVQQTRNSFAGAELHFLTIPASCNIIETHQDIDKLWIYDKHSQDRGVLPFLRLVKNLKKTKFDLAFIPHRSFRSALLCYLAGIPLRIGFDKSSGAFLFNRVVKYPESLHEADRNLQLLKALNVETPTGIFPRIYPEATDVAIVDNWLKNNIPVKRRLIALAPGSVWPTKRWPAENWGKLAGLLEENGFQTVFIGSQKDRHLLPEISTAFKKIEQENSMGEFTLRQTANLLSRCSLLISNDSAPTHLSVAMRTRVLTIFGPTIPGFGFYPYGKNDRIAQVEGLDCRPCSIHGGNSCPKKHFKCMRDLTAEMVFRIARGMLNGNS